MAVDLGVEVGAEGDTGDIVAIRRFRKETLLVPHALCLQ